MFRTGALVTVLAAWMSWQTAALADSPADSTPTPTVTPLPTVQIEPSATVKPSPRPRPTALPVPTARPTRTPRPTAPPLQPTAERPVKKKHRAHKTPTPSASPSPGPTRHAKHGRKLSRKHAQVKHAKATPTPSVTPVLNLHTEDSVAPVTCNGPGKPPAAHPFLLPPYHRWTAIVSYLDHDLPDFVQDGVITIASGQSASVDAVHRGEGFPAYWSSTYRQYLYYDGHNGYDYNLWYQPVYAAAAGKVIFARLEYTYAPGRGYGNMIMIEHRGGYVTLYGHLSKFLVHKGEKVKAGQEIAISGNTGHSTGPHLHFTVFHNCTPTDPYGWQGGGPDPLQSYQGESSEMLWKQVPNVLNPVPGLPGLLPAGAATRILLLRLPPAGAGTTNFSARLQAELDRAAEVLRKRGLAVKIDLLRGALIVSGSATPGSFYTVPGVISITTPDLEEGARADVLSELARASLVTHHHRIEIARSQHWSGYVVRLQGRAILVGKGEPGKQVDLELLTRNQAARVHRVATDPKSGAYAVDLGAVSPKKVTELLNQLSGRGSGGASVRVRQVAQPTPTPGPATVQTVTAPRTTWLPLVALIAVALAMCTGAAEFIRRRRHE
jgi:murein DD-endopeptidase MepM/ murein hydrolase activator NlpD